MAALTPAIRNWTLFSGQLGPVSFSFNAIFCIGVVLMLIAFAIQFRGISETAGVQKFMGLLVIIPMLVVGVLPIVTGQIDWSTYTPLVPLETAYPGWSNYGFETTVCYTAAFKDPGKDTFKAIFYSGLLCLLLYILVQRVHRLLAPHDALYRWWSLTAIGSGAELGVHRESAVLQAFSS